MFFFYVLLVSVSVCYFLNYDEPWQKTIVSLYGVLQTTAKKRLCQTKHTASSVVSASLCRRGNEVKCIT